MKEGVTRRSVVSIIGALLILSLTAHGRDTVVLLHGLVRTSHSMRKIERALEAEGYQVLNLDYPSRDFPIETLSEMVAKEITEGTTDADHIHIVTHSMGGILVRYIQQHFPIERLGKVVMLSPPNHGNEVVDTLGNSKIFRWINGPAGLQLGTEDGGLVAKLPLVDFELGVITGDRSINWMLSCMITGKDDGKVSITSAQIDGMSAFKIVHASHPFIMKDRDVIAAVLSFLKCGKFESASVTATSMRRKSIRRKN